MAEKWQEDLRVAFERATAEANVTLRDPAEDEGPITPESAETAAPEDEEQSMVDEEPRPFEGEDSEDAEGFTEEETEKLADELQAEADDETLSRAVKRAKAYIKLKVSPPDSALDQDPDALLEWAERIKAQEAWVEELKAERAKQRRGGETATDGEQEPAPVDLARELMPFLEELGLDAGSRAGQALLKALNAHNAPLMARLQEAEQTLRQREIRDMERELEGHRRRLAKTVPLLGRSRHAWRAVTILGAQMAQSEALGDREALERAVYEIYGERPLPKNGKADKVAITTQRPTVETQKVRSKPPTLDEWNRASFDYILSRGGHAEPHEVERALMRRFGHMPSRPRPRRY